MISFYIRIYEYYPSWLPFYIIDTLARLYSAICMYSLYIKYRGATRTKKLEDIARINSTEIIIPLTNVKIKIMPGGDGVLRIFDTFFCFIRLEIGGFLYVVLNIICSILIMLFLIVYVPMMDEEVGGGNKLEAIDIVLYVIAFIVNFAFTMSLIVGIRTVRKISFISLDNEEIASKLQVNC